jgi:hypothetical protein
LRSHAIAKVHKSRAALSPVNLPSATIRRRVPGRVSRPPTRKNVEVRERGAVVGSEERTVEC